MSNLPPGVTFADVSNDGHDLKIEPCPCRGEDCKCPDMLKCPGVSPDGKWLCDGQRGHKHDHFACVGEVHNYRCWPSD